MSSVSSENRREICKYTSRMLKSNSTHFFLLSILFLLPIFFTLIIYPSFHLAFFHQFSVFETVVLLCFYTLFLAIFFICAVATITHSAVEVFYGRSITLASSVKSIKSSFFPLISTLIVSLTIFVSIALFFALVTLFSVQILQTFGLSLDSNQFLNLAIFASILLVPVLVWVQVNWSLAFVIAVVESKWGFETLRKSACLVKGNRWVFFWMILFYGLVIGTMVVSCSLFLVTVDAAKGGNWRSLSVILQTAGGSVFGFSMMNQYLVVNVALYMYCNGEKLPLEVGNDDEYVSLPLDDEKNGHTSV